MPQYQSKTDSEEFEVAGQVRENGAGEASVSENADITIRVWQSGATASAKSVTWKTDSVLVYMVADLVVASHGRVDDSSPVMAAHFDNTGRALVAARRIQTAILEFLSCRPGDLLAAAVLIHVPATASGGFSAAMAQAALRLAEPGQILLSEEAADRIRGAPGIELRAVPSLTTGGEGQAELVELIWSSPEQLARLKASISGSEDAATMGATMIVNAPFEEPVARKTGQGATAQQKMGAADAVSGNPAADAHGEFEAQPAPSLNRTKTILAVVAVVLVGALVWLFYPKQTTKAPARVSETPTIQTPAPSTVTPSMQPQLQPPTSEAARPAVTVTKPAATGKPAAEKPRRDKPPATLPVTVPASVPEQLPQPVASVDGLTQKDIPNLLQKARSDAGSGNYENARREYGIILRLQPTNADAKEGLRRLDIAQSDH